MNRLAQLLQNVPDPEREPEAFAEWVAKRSVEVKCPACRNTWQRIGGKAGEQEICPECWDRGVRPGSWTPAISPKRQSRAELLAAAGVPYRFREPFEPRVWPRPDGVDYDTETWNGTPCFIGFLGDSGSGKTAMATELFWRRLQVVKSGTWIRADLLVEGLFRNDERAIAARDARLLLIDDLGWGVLGQAIEKLFGVIVGRHDDGLETIWTSNHPLSHYAKSLAGEALARRLRDEGLLVPVRGNWRDALVKA